MIDSTGNAVDRLLTAVNELHDADIVKRVHELEQEDQKPVAQLLMDFIGDHASEEQKDKLRKAIRFYSKDRKTYYLRNI